MSCVADICLVCEEKAALQGRGRRREFHGVAFTVLCESLFAKKVMGAISVSVEMEVSAMAVPNIPIPGGRVNHAHLGGRLRKRKGGEGRERRELWEA